MDYYENYCRLLDQLNFKFETKKVTHHINVNCHLLPFKIGEPSRVDFTNGFYRILGEFARIELGRKWDENKNINSIFSKEYIENLEIKDNGELYFENLLNEYLFDNKNQLNILNPYLFMYIPLSKNRRAKGEKDIAIFIRDVFCKNNDSLPNFLDNKDSNHIIVNFILNNVPNLPKAETKEKYTGVLDYIVELFENDIDFAVKHENFLVENIDKIFAYYYFFYITQFSLKVNQGFNADLTKNDKLYYLLDWESASKNRKTIGEGYSFLKERNKLLFVKMNVIDQLNTLLGTEGLLECELLEYYKKLDFDSQNSFISYLKKWISNYQYVRNFDTSKVSPEEYLDELSDNLEELVKSLSDSLNHKNGITSQIKNLYALNIEEIGKQYFLKRRGSYGYVFNINREMLLVLTALCVKSEKIKLTQLFEEYEKRGLYFDRYSQEEIVNFLTKLNLIDKKSDSGDAQYVKPIL